MPLYSWQNIQRRIKDIRYPVGCEVGVYQGNLSRLLLENIPDLTLYMVDSWADDTYNDNPKLHEMYDLKGADNYIKTVEAVKQFGERAKIIKSRSWDAIDKFADSFFNFIFIDANHTYYHAKYDIIESIPKVKSGGWLCGHDYGNPDWPGVKKAVDEIFGTQVEADSDFTFFIKIK